MHTHQIALRGLQRNIGQGLLLLLVHLAARVISLAPLWLAFIIPGMKTPLSLRCGLVLLLYLLLVYPLRARAALTLTCMTRHGNNSGLRLSTYPALVGWGALRMVLGALWGVPLALLSYRLYQYFFVFSGMRYSQDFEALSAYIFPNSPDANIGLLLYLGLMALSALLLLYGWWRGVAYDFQMVGDTTPLQALRRARRVRRRCRGKLWANACLHLPLCMLSAVVPCVIVYLGLAPMLTGYAITDIQMIFVYFSAGMFNNTNLLLSIASFLALYLPFFLYRKARNAAVVVNCYGKQR